MSKLILKTKSRDTVVSDMFFAYFSSLSPNKRSYTLIIYDYLKEMCRITKPRKIRSSSIQTNSINDNYNTVVLLISCSLLACRHNVNPFTLCMRFYFRNVNKACIPYVYAHIHNAYFGIRITS